MARDTYIRVDAEPPPFSFSRHGHSAVYTFPLPLTPLTQALASMREMAKIQGRRGILYAGAWLGYGLHEDGFTSGLRAATHHIPGVRPPFDIVAPPHKPVHVTFLARIFDVLEWSGARNVLGQILSFLLMVLGKLVLVELVDSRRRNRSR